ncbi:MAG: hypothetical protein FWD40_06100, partial [Treponema sp.]|nr:hypothetical protein [Treponema sp.]
PNNVRNGQAVSNVTQYNIRVVAYNAAGDAAGQTLAVWNIPGMNITQTNTAAVSSQSELTDALDDTAKTNIVLTNSFSLNDWTPIDLTDRNFYGNGHTITVNSVQLTVNNGNIGLFGAVSGNSLIRDLAVEYTGTQTISNPASGSFTNSNDTDVTGSNVGGITGYAIGNTQILNCIVRGANSSDAQSIPVGAQSIPVGALTVSASSGDQIIRLGGIAGYFEGNGKIENCLAALSVKYALTATDAHTGEVLIGGIAGETGEGGTANTLRINNEYTSTNAARGPDVTLQRLLINGVTITADVSADKTTRNGILAAGGAVGRSELNTMNDIAFAIGTVSYYRTVSTDTNSIGGIVGHAILTNIIESQFYGNIETIGGNETRGALRLGGIVGYNQINSTGNYFIHKCNSRTNIKIKAREVKNIGGILGWSSITQNNGTSVITNTYFEEGTIDISGRSGAFQIGGFTGLLGGASSNSNIFNNCGVLSGTMLINTDEISSDTLHIGGFISYSGASISNCFSRMDINVYSLFTTAASLADNNIGGFTGRLLNGGSIRNCYTAGTVHVIQNAGSPHVNVNVGGLVGRKEGGGSTIIENCYALGNVIADKQSGTGILSAGGLVGYNLALTGNISNSFAAGQVIAQSASGEAYAGGLVGYRDGGAISNTAALGASVTAQGPTRHAGRISGFPIDTTAIGSGNRVKQSMRIEEGIYAQTLFNNLAPTDAGNATQRHGATFSDSMFFNLSFWTGTGSLGFPAANWNFNNVSREGFPRLRISPNGAVMPGQ